MRTPIAFLAAALAVSCASVPERWERPGATPAELNREAALCRNEARRVTAGDTGPFVGATAKAAFDDCLVSRGWFKSAGK